MDEKITNAEYMINLLMDFLDGNDIEFRRISIDDGGASEESMIYYNVACPYFDGDERCECKDTGPDEKPTREMCSECKYKWMDLHGGRVVTNIDEYFHRICNHFAEIRWKDFPEDGTDDLHLYQYYYAEDELYVIKSNISDMIAFERAKSPIDALRSLEDKMERKSNSLVFINYEGEE